MGLSSFNRMRRERNEVEKLEAERFKIANEARHAARKARDEAREQTDAMIPDVRRAEAEAVERIGEKNVAGLTSNDLPMRKDHAAEIAGRNLEDVQAPKDPVERREERVPSGGTANEELVEHMVVDQPGPSPEMVEEAQEEAGVIADGPPADPDDLTLAEGGTADLPESTEADDPAEETNEAGAIEEAAEEAADADIDAMTVAEMREYARTNKIDLGGATLKDDIAAALKKRK